MVESEFGILCNKWRIFHRAIDVRPAFCNVTGKTCCILHNFVCQKDSFHFQDTLYECLLRVLRLLALEVMLQERPWQNTLRHISPRQRALFLGSTKRSEVPHITNTENARTFSAETQHSTWYCNTFIWFTSEYWLQGVLYFVLLRNTLKVYKQIVNE